MSDEPVPLGRYHTEEPSNGELARRLDEIRDDIRQMGASLVGRAEYAADQRGIEHRFTEVVTDIEDVRRQHADDIRAVNERITSDMERTTANRHAWRSAIWTGLIPAAVVLVSVLVQILLNTRGGKP